ncbi:MAG: type II toxin-antitoxin system Phd/YefM family antitoxin [Deltaproteobacteria bacterium]
MIVDTNHMIPVTRLQRELTKVLREISESEEPLYVLKNNEVNFVILPAKKYETLSRMEELMEHYEIADMIEERLKDYNRVSNVPWNDIKKTYDL